MLFDYPSPIGLKKTQFIVPEGAYFTKVLTPPYPPIMTGDSFFGFLAFWIFFVLFTINV